jgi:branched-chain amino acid transport system substrate-binding protein
MERRLFTLISMLVMLSMVLAACAPSPDLEQTPGAPAVPVTGYQCDDPIGCAEIAQGQPIPIAYALVIAGPNESLGIDSRNGIEIAVADQGDILGHPIDLMGEDEGCSAEGGQAAASRLAANPNIVAVIGTSCSSAARVAIPLLSDAGFAIVSPSNTAPDLTEEGNPNHHPGYLRTAHNDLIQGAAAARFAHEHLGAMTAATIHDGSLYADKLQEVFVDEFQLLGGSITSQEAIDPNQTDMGAVLTRIASAQPDLIYFPIFLPAGGFILRQAQETSGLEDTILMGADGLFSPDVVQAGGDAIEGFYVSSPLVSGPAYDEFVGKYQDRYGQEPISIFHAHAYDAAMMIFHAIEQVGVQDEDGTLHIPRQALRDALYAIQNFPGLIGNISCTPTGDCADPEIAVYQYSAGQYPPVLIWP